MDKYLHAYTQMVRIRIFEETLAVIMETEPKRIKCPVHLYTGQEAVAAGVCVHLNDDDFVFSTHRSHGHYLAKGGSMKALADEVFGKPSGCSKGYGGSMHLIDLEHGLPGSSAIVGGTIPLAVGAALAFKIKNNNRVSVCFFGDGATNEGVFYESLNLAALYKLPVLFVCENNLYSTHMRITKCLANTSIVAKAKAMGVKAIKVDGNNLKSVMDAAGDFPRNDGPMLLECMTYRWRGHVGSNYDTDKGIRTLSELNKWMMNDPLKTAEIEPSVKNSITQSVMNEVSECVK